MNNSAIAAPSTSADHLVEYVAGVSKLPEKLALIAAHHRSAELSLARAAAALRSMGALSRGQGAPDSRNCIAKLGNAPSTAA